MPRLKGRLKKMPGETTMKACLSSLVFAMSLACLPACAQQIRFVTAEIPPITTQKDGKPDGAALLILAELCKKMQVPFEVRFLPWSRAQLDTQEGKDFAIAPLARSAEREPLYKWVGPLISDQIVLMTKKAHKSALTTLPGSKNLYVGFLRASPTGAILKEAGFTKLEEANDEETSARMLEAERLDAWAVSRLLAPYTYRKLGFDPSELASGVQVRPNIMYLGFSRNVPDETIAKWQKALDELQASGKVAEILRQYE